jgi:hypothetical protein
VAGNKLTSFYKVQYLVHLTSTGSDSPVSVYTQNCKKTYQHAISYPALATL